MTNFHQPDIDEWQPTPRIARLAARYTRIRKVAVEGCPKAHIACLVADSRYFTVSPPGGFDDAEKASDACYRLACALNVIVEDELELPE